MCSVKPDLSILFFFNPESIISAEKNTRGLLCMATALGVVFELEGICSKSLQQVMPVKWLQAARLCSRKKKQMLQKAFSCVVEEDSLVKTRRYEERGVQSSGVYTLM